MWKDVAAVSESCVAAVSEVARALGVPSPSWSHLAWPSRCPPGPGKDAPTASEPRILASGSLSCNSAANPRQWPNRASESSTVRVIGAIAVRTAGARDAEAGG
jgi:hypothetical protein